MDLDTKVRFKGTPQRNKLKDEKSQVKQGIPSEVTPVLEASMMQSLIKQCKR